MKLIALPVLMLVAGVVRGEETGWKQDPAAAARGWYEKLAEGELKGLEVRSIDAIALTGPGGEVVSSKVRIFQASAAHSGDGTVRWDSRRIAVKRDGTVWTWTGSLEDVRAVLDACGLRGTDDAGMRAAAEAVLALPDGPGFDEKRASISGRVLTYREHRATGGFGCGFMGAYSGDTVLAFDEKGALSDLRRESRELNLEEYRALRKSGDPLLVDDVQGAEEFIKMTEDSEKWRDAQLAALRGDDDIAGEAAERTLSRGGVADAALEKSLAGASPKAKERIERVRRWTAPGFAATADEEARRWYEKGLPNTADPWCVRSFDRVELKGGAEALAGGFRLYRADCMSATGVQGKQDLVLAAKDGRCSIYTGDADQLREVLDRCGLLSDGGDGTRRAVLAAAALPVSAWGGKIVKGVDPARIEVRGRDGILHMHEMTLLSGRIGSYTEDVTWVFDEDGRLKAIGSTGIRDLTMADVHRLLKEADPWLELGGFVPDDMRADLEKAQAKKEKTPPRHGAK